MGSNNVNQHILKVAILRWKYQTLNKMRQCKRTWAEQQTQIAQIWLSGFMFSGRSEPSWQPRTPLKTTNSNISNIPLNNKSKTARRITITISWQSYPFIFPYPNSWKLRQEDVIETPKRSNSLPPFFFIIQVWNEVCWCIDITDISPQHCQVSIQGQAQTPAERQPGHVGARLEGAGQLHFRAGSGHWERWK